MDGLVDTKNEYIEHLQDIITIPISKRVYSIYNDCINRDKKSLKEFQSELMSIKRWNNNIVKEEYKRIIKETKCKYFENLIKIIIITSVKIKIYEYKDYFNNIKIKIPEPEDFIHKCYINTSIYCWKNAYLFNIKNMRDSEIQNNFNIIEENIRYIIKKTFRDFIPLNEILEQIQNNLTNNVTQFTDTPKKSVKENKYKKETLDDTKSSTEEENSTEESDSNDSEDESQATESEESNDSEESNQSEESTESNENSIKYNPGEQENKEEKEALYTENVIDESENKDEEHEKIAKEETIDYTNIKTEENYKEEKTNDLSENIIETTIVNIEDTINDVDPGNFYNNVTDAEEEIEVENIVETPTEAVVASVTAETDYIDVVDNDIKHVSIESPISSKPKKLTFF